MKKKQTISLLLAAALCVSLLGGLFPAEATEGFSIGSCGCWGMYYYCTLIADQNDDGYLSPGEIEQITSFDFYEVTHKLYLMGYNVDDSFENLKLLRNFTSLQSIKLNGIYFQNMDLDLSGLDKLEYLWTPSHSVTSLNISGCSSLKTLLVMNNPDLHYLDLSGVNTLEYLSVDNCGLSSLNLGSQPNLRRLSCYNNSLNTLDLSKCPQLDAAVRYGERSYPESYENTVEIELGSRRLWLDTKTNLKLADRIYNPFTDVPLEKYYYEPVMWAYYHDPQITGGTSATKFSPGKDCTREQIMTFLWKANGAPDPTMTANPFPGDVNPSKYYYKAILWAVENKYASGTGNGKFGVGKPCTRAQTVTFLWKAAGSPQPSSTTNPFPVDVNPKKYYYKAILWAVENKITSGTGSGKFGVSKTCTRGQVVTFLYKWYSPKG